MSVFSAEDLRGFAHALFRAAGFDEEKAETTARLLVLTDMMGRRTHGLAMLPLYLRDAQKGTLTVSGVPEIVKDTAVERRRWPALQNDRRRRIGRRLHD